MKQWKLVLVALLSVLLVCICTSALAEEGTTCQTCTPYFKVTKAATCKETGLQTMMICKVDGCANKDVPLAGWVDVEIPKTENHVYGDLVPAKAASCEEDGYTAYKICTVCGYKDGGKVIAAYGHNKVLNEHTKLPTCSEAGIDTYGCLNGCGETWEVEVAIVADAHAYVGYKAKAATCTEAGNSSYQRCSICGNEKGKVVIAALGHDKVLNEHTKLPTCTEAGIDTYGCLNGCGETWEVEVAINPEAHKWVGVEAKPATCEEDGYCGHHECALCGAKRYYEVEKALGHDKVLNEHTKLPTCTEAGIDTYGCLNGCGETWEVEIAINPEAHKWFGVEAKAATCEKDGYCGHHECALCGAKRYYEVEKAKGHDWKEITIPATCTAKGYTRYECKNEAHVPAEDKATVYHDMIPHDYKFVRTVKPTCTEEGYDSVQCTVCKAYDRVNKVAATGHHYDKPTALVENHGSSCTAKGYQLFHCDDCGKAGEKKVELPLLPHNYVNNWQVNVPAICGVAGVEVRVCTKCTGAPEYREIPALNHKFAKAVATTPATCEKAGEGVEICELCGLRNTVVLEALGHKWTEGPQYEVKPTCDEDGVKIWECQNDKTHQKKEVVPTKGHLKVWEDVVVPATCTGNGLKHVWCDECKKLIEGNVIIPATGHTWVEGDKVAATCTTTGSVEKVCEVCKVAEVAEIAALGHDMTKVKAVVAPTCTEEGYTVYTCTRGCDVTVNGATKAALGHNYAWVVTKDPSAAGNGVKEEICSVCGAKSGKTEYIKYTEEKYNATLTVYGPSTKELGGNVWNRVAPIDLTVDATYTLPLVASNKYVVGTVTIVVANGTLTVSYDTNSWQIKVSNEALNIYASKADLIAGNGVVVPVGTALNIAETFGADTKVIVALVLEADFDAAGVGVYGLSVNADEIAAMLVNVD